MTKKYLTAALLVLSMCTFSQENKNRFMINGSVHYSNEHLTDKMNSSNYSDSYGNNSGGVNFGYFLSNNFAVGISGAINRSITKNRSNTNGLDRDYNYTEKDCGIFARYNHPFKSGKLGFFLQLGVHYLWGDEHTIFFHNINSGSVIASEVSKKHMGFLAILNPGIIYFINNKFSIESSLGSIYSGSDNVKYSNGPTNEKKFRLGADFYLTTINLGFTYYFGGKKL